MSKPGLVELKSQMKKEIDKNIFFPGIIDQVNSLEFFTIKPMLNVNKFKFNQKEYTNSSPEISNEEIFNLSFSYENEYISKPFSFYTSKPINKIFFLSNLYKIFIVNIPQTLTFSIFDFYSLIILLCPDFPKTIIKKLSILMSNFSNNNLTPEAFNENIELKQRVNIIEIFSMFCVYFIYSDFFFELDKIFVHANVPSLSVKEIKKVKGIKKEFLYQIMILCVLALLEEYNLNTVSTFEDVEEIIEKGNDHKINYSTLNEKTLKNKAIILDIFNIDSIAYNYLYLLNCLTFNTE